jgi:preprotein translocase subunit SecE
MITIDLYKINFKKAELEKVELTISKYLPVYVIWVLIVVFGFPLFFGMK